MQAKTVSRKPSIPPAVYNVPEIAALLDLNLIATYELTRREGFPAIRIGRRVIVPKAAFHAWLDGQAAAGK